MRKLGYLKSALAGGASLFVLATAAHAENFNIPGGDLEGALNAYASQTGVALIVSDIAVKGARSKGARGELTADAALSRILEGTGFTTHRTPSGAVGVVHEAPARQHSEIAPVVQTRLAAAATASAGVEAVVVTSSKIKGDIQTVPIAITALSQEQLTSRQIAGGPDLIKEVPNLTFSKTNFTGYNIQIRGIGTQAISVTTDPAVAVAFNDIPFIRNHFFEQEFYDVGQVEVLRGPQGTLYGRNATAGVVNVVSAKPSDKWEAMASVDVGNYQNRRLEGMLNIPIVGDRLGLRVAGEWTRRDGYSFNATTNKSIDGRDLWSGRVTVGFHPVEKLQAYAVWEHFSEDDDRMRTAKQLCKKDPGPQSLDGLDLDALPTGTTGSGQPAFNGTIFWRSFMSQGCVASSLYSPDAYQTPNGLAIPFVFFLEEVANAYGGAYFGRMLPQIDPYQSQTQSRDLRVIESELEPIYHARNDTLEFNAEYDVLPTLALFSQTGYGKDRLYSTEDFNRFNTRPNIFAQDVATGFGSKPVIQDGQYCDPQLGCSSKLVGQDLSQERAWQFSQEVRLTSTMDGPFNFSVGANYLHYRTVEDYFVFVNLLSLISQKNNKSGAGDFLNCYPHSNGQPEVVVVPDQPYFDSAGLAIQGIYGCNGGADAGPGTYIDPNPLDQINGNGHNYFRSQNPYRLNSFAGFGEVYYQVAPDVKLTGGLRWTDDSKRFWNIPSWVLLEGGGDVVQDVIDQSWKEWTGRFNADWTPKLDFTDQTMVYASYSRGYKGGGANPPPPIAQESGTIAGATIAVHPASFAPEFVNAFEVGTKNTLLDGGLTMNGDVFYYDYTGYQISEIVDRTSVNINVDAKVKGAELETTWEPMPGLRFNLGAGYEDTSINKGQSSIDLIDRTAGDSDWVVVKPFVSETSNCILPTSTMRKAVEKFPTSLLGNFSFLLGVMCDAFYNDTLGSNPSTTAFRNLIDPNFDPSTAPNSGAGFSKDLGGNQLPNTPHFTASLSGEYTMPLSESWAATLHADFYWQGNSYTRIFNDKPYDKLRGYSTTNFALVLTNADGWQVMGYVKNVFDKTAITGAFLNSDDTALTTNVFVTDPRLFGVRITKSF